MATTVKERKTALKKSVQEISNEMHQLFKMERQLGKSKDTSISYENPKGTFTTISRTELNKRIKTLRTELENLPLTIFPKKAENGAIDSGKITNFEKVHKLSDEFIAFLKEADFGVIEKNGVKYDIKKELNALNGVVSRTLATTVLNYYLRYHKCWENATVNKDKDTNAQKKNIYSADTLLKKHFSKTFQDLHDTDMEEFKTKGIKEGTTKQKTRSVNPDVFTNQYHVFNADCFAFHSIARIAGKHLTKSTGVKDPSPDLVIKYHTELKGEHTPDSFFEAAKKVSPKSSELKTRADIDRISFILKKVNPNAAEEEPQVVSAPVDEAEVEAAADTAPKKRGGRGKKAKD